jgi:hypothetical protein
MKAKQLLLAVLAALPLSACELIEQDDTDPPILFNLGVELDSYDSGTQTAGAFVLDTGLASIFTEFGPEIPTFGFSYVVSTGADVVAPLSGKVSSLTYDDGSQTYEVRIRPKTDSVWMITVGNVALPAVADGDVLAAGDALGEAGSGAPLGYGMATLRVDDTDKDKSWCPLAVFDSATLLTVSSQLGATLVQFETLKSDPSIYDEAAWFMPGCTAETVPY